MNKTKPTNHIIVPKDIAKLHGGARRFRVRMRRCVTKAQAALRPFKTLGPFTNAHPDDIHDVQVLLDRIQRDLSQRVWGK